MVGKAATISSLCTLEPTRPHVPILTSPALNIRWLLCQEQHHKNQYAAQRIACLKDTSILIEAKPTLDPNLTTSVFLDHRYQPHYIAVQADPIEIVDILGVNPLTEFVPSLIDGLIIKGAGTCFDLYLGCGGVRSLPDNDRT